MDHNLKLKQTIDTLFGAGVSKLLPKGVELKKSKKTGRIRSVYDKEQVYDDMNIKYNREINQSRNFKRPV